jgi:hypothetical protein
VTASDIVKILAGNAVLFSILQWAASVWLKARLDASIKNEYDRRLEEYRRELDRRERAGMVAELFAEWASFPADPKHLNHLSFEAALWLPADIVKEIGKRLSNSEDAKDVKVILADVRRHLVSKPDDITADHIVHFPKLNGPSDR